MTDLFETPKCDQAIANNPPQTGRNREVSTAVKVFDPGTSGVIAILRTSIEDAWRRGNYATVPGLADQYRLIVEAFGDKPGMAELEIPVADLVASVFPDAKERYQVACLIGGMDGRLAAMERALRDFSRDSLEQVLENQEHHDDRLKRLENLACFRQDPESQDCPFGGNVHAPQSGPTAAEAHWPIWEVSYLADAGDQKGGLYEGQLPIRAETTTAAILECVRRLRGIKLFKVEAEASRQ